MQADPLIAPDPAASATLDDPLEQGGYTSWSSVAGGEKTRCSNTAGFIDIIWGIKACGKWYTATL